MKLFDKLLIGSAIAIVSFDIVLWLLKGTTIHSLLGL
jgi:hypothetical protein